jgi:cytochrome c-type biogenesis protein CcmH
MTEAKTTSGRIAPATIALIIAALLAAAGIAVALFRSGDEPASATVSTNAAQAEQPGDMAGMIAALGERVRQDPDDHQSWFELGFLLRNSGRYVQAEQAFRRAAELAPNNANYLAYRAEILLVMARNDEVPPEAERLLRRVIELEPNNAQAKFYLATIRDIKGEHRGAVDDLIALLRSAPPGASWEPQVRTALVGIAREHAIDIEGRLPPQRAAPTASATAAIPGPSREQMEQARAIPPAQQDEMVKGMVDRLAARLRQNPRNAEGWVRLMRSRMVLNDPGAASEALRSGLAAFEGDAATQARLRSSAAELGVPTN